MASYRHIVNLSLSCPFLGAKPYLKQQVQSHRKPILSQKCRSSVQWNISIAVHYSLCNNSLPGQVYSRKKTIQLLSNTLRIFKTHFNSHELYPHLHVIYHLLLGFFYVFQLREYRTVNSSCLLCMLHAMIILYSAS